MEIPAGLISLVVTLIIVAYIAQPFFSTQQSSQQRRTEQNLATILRQQANLYTERNRIYQAITDLDFDYATNKISGEEFALQRHRFVAQGVSILQQLDALAVPEEDPIESAVHAWKARVEVLPAPPVSDDQGARFCPRCGERATAGDRFCGSCGARL